VVDRRGKGTDGLAQGPAVHVVEVNVRAQGYIDRKLLTSVSRHCSQPTLANFFCDLGTLEIIARWQSSLASKVNMIEKEGQIT